MTRSNAREVAVHMIYELGFGSRSAEELLEHEMTRERFAQLGEEEPLYAQFPNEKQRQYIRDLVQGVYVHGPELDDYISRYSVGWSFARIPRMAAAVMRTAMYEVLYMPAIPNSAAINEAVEIAKNYEPATLVPWGRTSSSSVVPPDRCQARKGPSSRSVRPADQAAAARCPCWWEQAKNGTPRAAASALPWDSPARKLGM